MRNVFMVLILILFVCMVAAFASLSDVIGGNTLDEFVFNPSEALVFSDMNADNPQLNRLHASENSGIVPQSFAINDLLNRMTLVDNTRNIGSFGWVKGVSTTRCTKPGDHII